MGSPLHAQHVDLIDSSRRSCQTAKQAGCDNDSRPLDTIWLASNWAHSAKTLKYAQITSIQKAETGKLPAMHLCTPGSATPPVAPKKSHCFPQLVLLSVRDALGVFVADLFWAAIEASTFAPALASNVQFHLTAVSTRLQPLLTLPQLKWVGSFHQDLQCQGFNWIPEAVSMNDDNYSSGNSMCSTPKHSCQTALSLSLAVTCRSSPLTAPLSDPPETETVQDIKPEKVAMGGALSRNGTRATGKAMLTW